MGCNSGRHKAWTQRYEFKSWTRLFAFNIALIYLGKDVYLTIVSPVWENSNAD